MNEFTNELVMSTIDGFSIIPIVITISAFMSKKGNNKKFSVF